VRTRRRAPLRELAVVGRVDPQPAGHLATSHLHRARARGGYELVGLLWVDAHEQATLPARRDGHVAGDEEREPAEHLLLRQPRLA
jgi:hypothetical protein